MGIIFKLAQLQWISTRYPKYSLFLCSLFKQCWLAPPGKTDGYHSHQPPLMLRFAMHGSSRVDFGLF